MSLIYTPAQEIETNYSYSVRSKNKDFHKPLHKSFAPTTLHTELKAPVKSPQQRTKFPEISNRARRLNQQLLGNKQFSVGKPQILTVRNPYQKSTKLFRRQVYEAARKNQSIDIDMVLP